MKAKVEKIESGAFDGLPVGTKIVIRPNFSLRAQLQREYPGKVVVKED